MGKALAENNSSTSVQHVAAQRIVKACPWSLFLCLWVSSSVRDFFHTSLVVSVIGVKLDSNVCVYAIYPLDGNSGGWLFATDIEAGITKMVRLFRGKIFSQWSSYNEHIFWMPVAKICFEKMSTTSYHGGDPLLAIYTCSQTANR